MKKTSSSKIKNTTFEDLLPEYHFDYRKSRPNRFASKIGKESRIVVLDPDVSQVFDTSESVNKVLRALINTMTTLLKPKKPNGK